jgi:alcohol dehydrogenase, propanol-preferring
MRAMVLKKIQSPLVLQEVPIPKLKKGQVLLEIHTCGICRTDLHILDGELAHPRLPLILGHQIVGKVIEKGPQADRFEIGQCVGVPWVGKTCGCCRFCLKGLENLCENPLFTGYDVDGGYAQYCASYQDYCYPLPASYLPMQAAPLLCGGLIGFRAFRMVSQAQKIGFYGFGSSAHILMQIANHLGKQVYVFTRPNDESAQTLAKTLGAAWVGSSEEPSPILLDAALIFASVGALIPQALQSLDKGGTLVCLGIHMSAIPSFPYRFIYGERSICSVTNLTRKDGEEFFELIKKYPIHTHVTAYPLEEANQALCVLRDGKAVGSLVLDCHSNRKHKKNGTLHETD